MPCVPGIRSKRTLECLEIYLRLRSSEALVKSALAFPGSSMSPGGIVFPRESEAEGVDSLYTSTPPQTDTGTDCGGSTHSFLLVTLMLSRLTLTFTTGSTLMGLNLTYVRLLRDCNSHGGLTVFRLGWSSNCG